MTTTAVRPIPEGYHTVTPYIFVREAARAIDFYVQAFGANELLRMPMPDGRIGHAEIRIGTSMVMLADEAPEMDIRSPQTLGGVSSSICLYVEDVDSAWKRAIDAGCKEVRALKNQFYGHRSGSLEDPFGHHWTLATHVEDVTLEQIAERLKGTASGG